VAMQGLFGKVTRDVLFVLRAGVTRGTVDNRDLSRIVMLHGKQHVVVCDGRTLLFLVPGTR